MASFFIFLSFTFSFFYNFSTTFFLVLKPVNYKKFAGLKKGLKKNIGFLGRYIAIINGSLP